jgi:hypothetical protein
MQNNIKINKKIAYAITTILLLATTATFAVLPLTFGATATEVPTFLEINVAPNPIGMEQIAHINVFMSKPPLTAGLGGSGTMYKDMKVEVTKPDGTKQTLGPYTSDSTGGAWDTFVPTMTGNYTFKATYAGQRVEETVTDFLGFTNHYNITYLASESDTVTLTVQQEAIPGSSTTALPTEYWSRPIYATNYLWSQLGGSWYGLAAPAFATTGDYDASGNFQAYSEAPNTGHIMWTSPTHFGGQVGLPIPNDQMSQYMSTTIATNYFEPIILNGVLYYTEYAGPNAAKASWVAVDIRTGETLWTRSAGESGNEVIRMGQILRFHSIQEYGSWAFLYSCPSASFFGTPGYMAIYDAYTGEYMANITNIQNPSFIMDTDPESTDQLGTLLGYYTNGGSLYCWNSTKLMMSKSWDQITIRPSGTYNWTDGIQWSVPLDSSAAAASIIYRAPDKVVLRYAPSSGTFSSLSYGSQVTIAYNGETGEKLWGPKNQTIPELQDVSVIAAGEGYYILHNKDTDEAYGYSLETGDLAWGPIKLPGNAWSTISRAAEIAYGKVYVFDFGGYVNALTLKTGAIEWTHVPRSAGYDTSYGVYPLWYNGMIADGKLFISESHMYDPPMYPGAKQIALNCTTGEEVWSELSFTGRVPTACADGYLIQWNSYDSQIYSIGKGPTETTIAASPKITEQGNLVLVEGTVMDTSVGTKDLDRTARFPAGVPAISDESQSAWMEYVYMQQTKPTNATGVPLIVSVTDPNGNTYVVGTTTSDMNGHYKTTFTPPVTGAYTVTATFPGTESYWSSAEQTAIDVVDAPATATPMPTAAPSAADLYFLPAIAALFIAIVLSTLLMLVLLRKRP